MHPIAALDRFRALAPSTFGRPPSLDWIAIDRLDIDDTYQRPVLKEGEANIRAIVQDFDWQKFAPLIVAAASAGRFAVIDGQHRAIAAATVGLDLLPCMVVKASAAEQAAIFDAVNGNVTRVTWHARFKARLAAGDAKAAALVALAQRAGVTLLLHNAAINRWRYGETAALSTIARLVARHNEAIVVLALRCALRSRPRHPDVLRGAIIEPIADTLGDHPFWADQPAVVEAFEDIDLVRRHAKARRAATGTSRSVKQLLHADIVDHLTARLGRPAASKMRVPA